MLYCIHDAYDPDGSIPYANVEEFLSMCDDAFGRRPELTETARNVWTDADGAVVLMARGYYVAHAGWREYYPDAATPAQAAQEYADGGDWHLEPGQELTLALLVWELGEEPGVLGQHDVTVVG